MKSTSEEFGLLLTNWKMENARVRINSALVCGDFRAASISEGELSFAGAGLVFGISSDDGSTFMFSASNCVCGYATPSDLGPEVFAAIGLSPDEVEDVLMASHTSGSKILLFRLRD